MFLFYGSQFLDGAQLSGQEPLFAEIGEGRPIRLVFGSAGNGEFLVTIVEMLRQLFDNLPFARGRQAQTGEAAGDFDAPVRHVQAP